MCNERERLIGYVYDECDDGERRAIEGHLETCGTCRTEIAGLRRLRQDLLAWDVPEHDSVWRPFAPARALPWWREIPGWALAAAAVAMFAVGAGGGVVTHALAPHESPAGVSAAAAASTPAEVTAADLAAFETRMLGLMQTQAAANGAAPSVQRVSMSSQERAAFEAEIIRRVRELQTTAELMHDETWGLLAGDFAKQTERVNKLSRDVEDIQTRLLAAGFQGR